MVVGACWTGLAECRLKCQIKQVSLKPRFKRCHQLQFTFFSMLWLLFCVSGRMVHWAAVWLVQAGVDVSSLWYRQTSYRVLSQASMQPTTASHHAILLSVTVCLLHSREMVRHCLSSKGKGKVDHAPPERRWGAHLPLVAFEPLGG